jgi:zinc transporter ZupT
MLRSGVGAALTAAVLVYVGIIAIACIRLGSVASIVAVAKIAFPWFVGSLVALLAGALVYVATLLAITRHRLRGTGVSLSQFMSLPLNERHAFMQAHRRGPYRDA